MSSGEECSGNLLLFLVDINNIALLSLLTDYWDAIRILGSDFVSLILAFLKFVLSLVVRHCSERKRRGRGRLEVRSV